MIAIKNTEMPKHCGKCRFNLDGCIFAEKADISIVESFPYRCPLVEIEERKVGKWIYDKGSYICPFCEHKITGLEKDLNYCCKCGAKMEGCEE